ncbi:MAG: response regulator, partial [Planctomycetota bacterium]|nr:response regulator [Planctomycetota bacterium]
MMEARKEKQGLEPEKILVVDDNEELLGAVSRLLELQGYTALTATSGEEALQIAGSELPDLILLDWILPGIDGIEVCRKLKNEESTRGIMVLLLTGRGSVDSRIEGLDAGADDFIPKPFKHPELLARIRSSLRLKKTTDELTERNRQLVESQYELVRTEKIATIGLLASGIAHEFNNIMAGISGYAQLASKNPKYMPQLVEVALTQARRAQELTGSLSSY